MASSLVPVYLGAVEQDPLTISQMLLLGKTARRENTAAFSDGQRYLFQLLVPRPYFTRPRTASNKRRTADARLPDGLPIVSLIVMRAAD